MTESAERRVKAGLTWLDAHYPEHLAYGDTDMISFGLNGFDPLSRVRGEQLTYQGIVGALGYDEALSHGFIPIGAPLRSDIADERRLTEQWREQYRNHASGGEQEPVSGATEFLRQLMKGLMEQGLLRTPGRPVSDPNPGFIVLDIPSPPRGRRVSEDTLRTFGELFAATSPDVTDGVEVDIRLTAGEVGDLLALAVAHAIQHQATEHPEQSWMACPHMAALVFNVCHVTIDIMNRMRNQ